MLWYRLARVCLHLFVGLWTCAVVFPWLDAEGRMRRIHRWSIQLLGLCRVKLDVIHHAAEPQPTRALIVANHISWLDIFVINSLHTCRFVAKSDIRGWPLIGWLCDKAGTIFIARGKLRDVRRIYEGLVHSLHEGEHVAFFPEGTTSEQGTVLPFHANLFEAAVEAGVPVQPFALRYVDAQGGLHPSVSFIGDMSFAQSMIAVLTGGPIHAELIRLPIVVTTDRHRRELAPLARQVIAEELLTARH
ncbi:MAG: 1-acyl-sn-glycerol-3-phosphate acyltransferase [Burkholderiales bacterium]|nr:1-acyl-sn-glycerol-3-phosphate acyltransferase [Burkholderiales bacterium]